MTCENTGPFYLGLLRESCENAKGRWKRGPCKQLKECVSDYPKKGEPGYSLSSAHYAKHRLYIEDANNEEQCNRTRAALGFPQDYPFDHDGKFSSISHISYAYALLTGFVHHQSSLRRVQQGKILQSCYVG